MEHKNENKKILTKEEKRALRRRKLVIVKRMNRGTPRYFILAVIGLVA